MAKSSGVLEVNMTRFSVGSGRLWLCSSRQGDVKATSETSRANGVQVNTIQS